MNSTSGFKDLFSRQSVDYAKFRPAYPDILFRYLSSLCEPGCPEGVGVHSLAWDCGTGNGQAAIKLADYFDKVIATDPSAKQLSSAIQHGQVEYRVGSAEKTTFADQSVNLITVAQAFHWFKQREFFEECRRVLKSKGILAFWCYNLCKITPEVDSVVLHRYKDVLGPYWEKERQLVEEGYRHVRMPLQEITPPNFEMAAEWSLGHLIGYLGTWSALQSYIDKNKKNPLETAFPDLKAAWGDVNTRTVRWKLALKVGRVRISRALRVF